MPLGLEFRAAASTGAPPDAAGPTAGPPLPGKTLAPGSLLDGRYLIQEELGRGGMGRVFAARDARIARPVAIKILSPGAHDDEDLRRFEQEARTAGSLNHPNIVAVLDIGKHEGEPYIVSELLEGTTLRERLRAGALPWKDAVGIAIQLAHGLSAAHDKGVIHRDLKPENLFVTRDGRLKILDFGVAKLVAKGGAGATGTSDQSSAPAVETQPGAAIGTVGYMSPEQVRGQQADPRSDIFAFGTILHEALCGRRAFARESAVETGVAILKDRPAALSAPVPRELDRIVARCLEKDPGERFQSVKDLAFDLEAVSGGALPPSLRRAAARRWALAGVAALVVAGAVAAVRSALRQWEDPVSPNVVAVLPFAVRGSDRFAYLAEGMVDLLSANLGGADLRVVDPHALVRFASRDASPLDASRARSIARHFGAGRFVLGSVLEVEKRVRIHAAIYDASAGAEPMAQASAEGGSDELFRLIDEMTAQLRVRVGSMPPPNGSGGRSAPSNRISTSSPEALKAYLEGEAELRRGSWRRARTALERAVVLDPEFALANYRLAVAASMWDPGLASDALQRALNSSERMSERDRALMQAFHALRQGRSVDAERGYRAALSAHPDDVEAWYELGELLFHFGPLRGNPATDARAPLEQALVLDPDHGGALYHLIDIAQMQGEPERALALSDRFLRAASEDVLLTARQWTRAWAARDEGSKARLREDWRRAGVSKEGLPFAWSCALWQRDDLGDAGGLAQLLAGSETAGKRAEGFEDLAMLDLARGRLRAAREKMARAVELAPQGPYRLESLWFDATDFLPISATDLQAARESARNLDVGEDPLRAAQLAFVSGALAVRAADLDAAERAAQQLDRMPPVAESSLAHDFALAIRARAAARSGRDDEALAALDRMRLQVPYRLSGAFVRVAEQHLRARLLEARGRDEDALRLYGVFSFYGRFEPIYFAQSHLRRAAIHDRRGERDEAMGHYRRFVELWRDSDPELQPLVEEAKRRLEQLGSKAGSSARAPGP